MKVKSNEPTTSGLPRSPVPAGGGEKTQAVFGTALRTARREALDGDFQTLLAEVRARGKRFLDRPDENTLETYKDGVRQFLKKVATEVFALKEDAGRPQDGQQKIYQLVETVREDLDSLTRSTLQQDKALGLLASLDDIRGLVLDLVT